MIFFGSSGKTSGNWVCGREMATIVVEHMEDEMFPWNICEYKHLIQTIGSENVIITNVTSEQASHFPAEWVKNFRPESASQFLTGNLDKTCLLDEKGQETLQPEDSSMFQYFLLGGILGNVDEFDQDRTAELRQLGFHTKSIGNVQMTLDTAAICTDWIVNKGKRFESLEFVDRPELQITTNESLVIPFRFLANKHGDCTEPLIAPGIVDLLREGDGFF